MLLPIQQTRTDNRTKTDPPISYTFRTTLSSRTSGHEQTERDGQQRKFPSLASAIYNQSLFRIKTNRSESHHRERWRNGTWERVSSRWKDREDDEHLLDVRDARASRPPRGEPTRHRDERIRIRGLEWSRTTYTHWTVSRRELSPRDSRRTVRGANARATLVWRVARAERVARTLAEVRRTPLG